MNVVTIIYLCGLAVQHGQVQDLSVKLTQQLHGQAYVFNLAQTGEFDYIQFQTLEPCIEDQMKKDGVK